MIHEEAVSLIKNVFENPYNEARFYKLIIELFENTEYKDSPYYGNFIPKAYSGYIKWYKYICKYTTLSGEEVGVLSVCLTKDSMLSKSRSAQRNFIANWMQQRNKDACLVAFYSDEDAGKHWRFSFVRLDNSFDFSSLKVKTVISPAKRYSYMIGDGESSHTAQKQLCFLLESDSKNPSLDEIESAFAVEKVSDEFFEHYKDLYIQLVENLNLIIEKDFAVKKELLFNKVISSELFCKKLMGQIVFLYFIQKKGWLGVEKDNYYGTGDKQFLRHLFDKAVKNKENYFNDYLEHLFYGALAQNGAEKKFEDMGYKIPYLNGGLFEPIYDWENTEIVLDNSIFSNDNETGILDIFDRYNFTVREDEPLEKEIAVDPEMLGKVFENLLEIKDRKSKGAFYTPREIVHYMCQESLIHYLYSKLSDKLSLECIEFFIRYGNVYAELQNRDDVQRNIEKIPEQFRQIEKYADEIDDALFNVKILDPAIGSGAFPVGMMHELIRARQTLLDSGFIKKDRKRTLYEYKKQIIKNSIYGCDIEQSAVEIAKLRLWLSLIVDEESVTTVKPLPNLDYKIICGNSLTSVSENLFNKSTLMKFEALKEELFDSIKNEKKKIKEEIADIERTLKEKVVDNKRKIKADIANIERTLCSENCDLKVYFSEVFRINGGFDIVIGNPPYVGEKGHKNCFEPVKKCRLGRFYQGKMDLFYFFFHLALDFLKDKGVSAFITTNYYITATGGIKLRTDLKDRANLLHLINFNELKIFKSALGQHNMITMMQKSDKKEINCVCSMTNKTGFALDRDLSNIMLGKDSDTNYSVVSQNKLYEGTENYIRLQIDDKNNPVISILDKIQQNNDVLGNICNVNQGIVSGADKISERHIRNFHVNAEKDDGIFVLNKNNVHDLNVINQIVNQNEMDLKKPFFKNSDVHRFYTETDCDDYILYLRKSFDNLSNYSIIKSHIMNFKSIIDKSSDNSPYLHRPRLETIFTGPKIVAPQRSSRNTFGYNEVPWYASADVYFITSPKKGYNLKYILGLLNSKLYYVWLYNKGKRKGEILELYQKPLSEIPIKKCDDIMEQKIVAVVDEIISNASNNKNIDILEKKLNYMIYELYKLTDEEIQFIESSVK